MFFRWWFGRQSSVTLCRFPSGCSVRPRELFLLYANFFLPINNSKSAIENKRRDLSKQNLFQQNGRLERPFVILYYCVVSSCAIDLQINSETVPRIMDWINPPLKWRKLMLLYIVFTSFTIVLEIILLFFVSRYFKRIIFTFYLQLVALCIPF